MLTERLPLRTLKIATVVMGLAIVLGTIVVVTVVVRRASGDGGGAAVAAATVLLDEPEGTRIAGVTAGPDRIAVILQGGGPDRISVVDPRSGRVVQRIRLQR